MRSELSSLVRTWQAWTALSRTANKEATDRKKKQLTQLVDKIKPSWVDELTLVAASLHRVQLTAVVGDSDWDVFLIPSFHGVHVKVSVPDRPDAAERPVDAQTQSRLSRAIQLNVELGTCAK
jgi:hypothetical protein